AEGNFSLGNREAAGHPITIRPGIPKRVPAERRGYGITLRRGADGCSAVSTPSAVTDIDEVGKFDISGDNLTVGQKMRGDPAEVFLTLIQPDGTFKAIDKLQQPVDPAGIACAQIRFKAVRTSCGVKGISVIAA